MDDLASVLAAAGLKSQGKNTPMISKKSGSGGGYNNSPGMGMGAGAGSSWNMGSSPGMSSGMGGAMGGSKTGSSGDSYARSSSGKMANDPFADLGMGMGSTGVKKSPSGGFGSAAAGSTSSKGSMGSMFDEAFGAPGSVKGPATSAAPGGKVSATAAAFDELLSDDPFASKPVPASASKPKSTESKPAAFGDDVFGSAFSSGSGSKSGKGASGQQPDPFSFAGSGTSGDKKASSSGPAMGDPFFGTPPAAASKPSTTFADPFDPFSMPPSGSNTAKPAPAQAQGSFEDGLAGFESFAQAAPKPKSQPAPAPKAEKPAPRAPAENSSSRSRGSESTKPASKEPKSAPRSSYANGTSSADVPGDDAWLTLEEVLAALRTDPMRTPPAPARAPPMRKGSQTAPQDSKESRFAASGAAPRRVFADSDGEKGHPGAGPSLDGFEEFGATPGKGTKAKEAEQEPGRRAPKAEYADMDGFDAFARGGPKGRVSDFDSSPSFGATSEAAASAAASSSAMKDVLERAQKKAEAALKERQRDAEREAEREKQQREKERERKVREERERKEREAREREAERRREKERKDKEAAAAAAAAASKAKAKAQQQAQAQQQQAKARPSAPAQPSSADDWADILGGGEGFVPRPPRSSSSGGFQEVEGESEDRRRMRFERHQKVQERAAEALEEKRRRDQEAVKEQEDRHRAGEMLDVEIKRWAAGKEGNLRALLSTLQFVLWPDCNWTPVSLTDLISGPAVKKAYRKACLSVHPDKVQQKGATTQQKYIAEKVFDLLKEAFNKFNSEELF